MLRPYQQAAHDAAISFIRGCLDPCLIEAATGAGKSHIIAAIADTMHNISGGKHILCLAPSKELIIQNREKYLATGRPASIMSASAGERSLKHPVVFGTPGTVKNRVRRFGGKVCCIVVDECHGITPTIKHIISVMKEANPKVRVIGLSATPYRLSSGYIYEIDEKNNPTAPNSTDPYFKKRVYTVHAKTLIDAKFLTQPVIGEINTDNYETRNMRLNSMGKFSKSDIDQAYIGQGRKTAAIIADVIYQSKNKNGVMVFAATVRHAQECMASLPPGLSGIITGDTKERDDIIKRFKAREIKYLVNVQVLTTGFDAPHVDVIALLRATESVSLLQQIIGRGLRIDDDKESCLVLDYAENLDRHCPDGDIFNPEIRAGKSSGGGVTVEASCPYCKSVNEFAGRPNDDGYEMDEEGYFVDLEGCRIETEEGYYPSHYGRRCQGQVQEGAHFEQCSYRWTFKECGHCGQDNDIAARYCTNCEGELVDPNEKLKIEFKEMKKDPTRVQTDKVIRWVAKPTLSKAGNDCVMINVTTEYRSFSVWLQVNGRHRLAIEDYKKYKSLGGVQPKTVTYTKQDTGFYKILSYNRSHDEIP